MRGSHEGTWFATDGVESVSTNPVGTIPGTNLGDILFNFNAFCKDHIKDHLTLNKELNRNSNLQARKVVLLAFCVFIL